MFAAYIPFILWFCLMAQASDSMKMAKSKGESGHHTTQRHLHNLCDVIPLVVTVAIGVLCSVFIQLMNDSPKPSFCRTVKRKIQLTLSNAFSASSETIIMLGVHEGFKQSF